MGLNVTNVFIAEACEALRWKTSHLSYEEKEDLCDELIKLCEKYAPGTFRRNEESENEPCKDPSDDISSVDDLGEEDDWLRL